MSSMKQELDKTLERELSRIDPEKAVVAMLWGRVILERMLKSWRGDCYDRQSVESVIRAFDFESNPRIRLTSESKS